MRYAGTRLRAVADGFGPAGAPASSAAGEALRFLDAGGDPGRRGPHPPGGRDTGRRTGRRSPHRPGREPSAVAIRTSRAVPGRGRRGARDRPLEHSGERSPGCASWRRRSGATEGSEPVSAFRSRSHRAGHGLLGGQTALVDHRLDHGVVVGDAEQRRPGAGGPDNVSCVVADVGGGRGPGGRPGAVGFPVQRPRLRHRAPGTFPPAADGVRRDRGGRRTGGPR